MLSPLKHEIRENFSTMADIKDIEFKNEQTLEISKVVLNEVNVFQEALGEVSGRACLSLPKKFAIDLGNKIFSKTFGEYPNFIDVTDDIKETIKELLNIILGKATELLEKDSLGLIFEPPVISLDSGQVLDGGLEAITVQTLSSIGTFDLFYFIK
ncbi:MAG: hypothetical protein LBI30_01220 [Holosporales bacterium]|nr:hypothetical protein [Holosporales bacterium]